VTYGGMTGWAASSYIAIQTGNGYTTNDNFGSTAAAVGIPLIAGIAIGSALAANSGPCWGPGWGPGPYRGWNGGGNVYNGCIGRNYQSNRGPARPHWTDPSRLERSSGLLSRFWLRLRAWFWPRPSHASRRQAVKPPLEPRLLTTFCQEHRRIR